ncbi:hypothetical protein MANES_09G124100v8 [Manihot esculenta]|uniref:PWWP domain-containing protein n=1 Tax=Manihot esculenta TaxID=3983 RepID=A0A2C9VA68_MANES|nr:hypothetical protein MANES_09G124100v8 [Manihot esculenta]
MGSSGSGAVDCGVGPIVWVRRRNGSWWPGKIMSPEELAECNLSSPRTGTPVKLLGREDASVDWYNLEKSKRVKAFRCGDFDDCIERAESAQGMRIKKREKYARREDAILHALELEKQMMKKQGKLSTTSDNQRSKLSGPAKKDLGIASEGLTNNSGIPGNAKLNTSIKDEIIGIPAKAKDGNQPISGDDHSEATPRMRGLQDLGLRTASKRKLPTSSDSDVCMKPMGDTHFQVHPVDAPNMERRNHANGADGVEVIQAKRSRCVYSPADSSDYLDDKELLPNQIKMLPSKSEDDDDHPHHSSLKEQNSSSGFMENLESDSSGTDSLQSESASSETEPDVADGMTVLPGTIMPTEAEQNALRQPEVPEHGTVSKWRLKGKRNIRHLTKKSSDRADEKVLNGPLHGTYHKINGSTLGQRGYSFDDADLGRKYIGMYNDRSSYASRYAFKGRNNIGHNTIDWRDMAWEDRPAFKGHLEDRVEHFNPIFFGRHYYGGRARSMLVDVDLKVQASYQKAPVPIVSLTSKLNGKAIIGHPIQIQALEEGSSETLISINDYHGTEAVDHDANTSISPAWRTARRTNYRVPRPLLSSVLGSEHPQFIDQEGRLPFRKLSVGNFSHKATLVRKSFPHTSRPSMDRKFQRKLQKKASLSSNKKTRTLSSIAVQQSFSKPLHYSSISQMGGLLKSETTRPTTVACIPVKLVFSRLLEKINRPPSKAACKVVISNGNAERPPS